MNSSGTGYTAGELSTWIARVCAILDKRGEPFALMGGAAVMLFGRRARTRDIDFIALGSRDSLLKSAADDGLVVEVKSEWHVRLWSADRAHYADVVDANAPLLEEGVRRARRMTLANVDVPVVPPEVLVALKMVAGRPRDLRDVEDILENTETVDRVEVDRLLAPYELSLPR